MTLLTVPVIGLATVGTTMRGRDIWTALRCPLAAGFVAAVLGLAVSRILETVVSAPIEVVLGAVVIYGVYFAVLLFPLKQADLYRGLVRKVLGRAA
jgi:hypothetical protein